MEYTEVESQVFMNCPRDQQNLISKDYEHVSVHACAKCSGFWLNTAQLNQIVKTRENQFTPEQVQKTLKAAHAGIPDSEASTKLPCPECESLMGARNYDYSSGVMVNVCPKGHGLWFDQDELQSVEIFMEHWNDEAKTHQKEWVSQIKAAGADEDAVIASINDRILHDISPSGLLGSVFHAFEKMKR